MSLAFLKGSNIIRDHNHKDISVNTPFLNQLQSVALYKVIRIDHEFVLTYTNIVYN